VAISEIAEFIPSSKTEIASLTLAMTWFTEYLLFYHNRKKGKVNRCPGLFICLRLTGILDSDKLQSVS